MVNKPGGSVRHPTDMSIAKHLKKIKKNPLGLSGTPKGPGWGLRAECGCPSR
jgi:hypothetical protein